MKKKYIVSGMVMFLVLSLSITLSLAATGISDRPITPGEENSCLAYFEGYVYNSFTNECDLVGATGCDNPFEYQTIVECLIGNGVIVSECDNHPGCADAVAKGIGKDNCIIWECPEIDIVSECTENNEFIGYEYNRDSGNCDEQIIESCEANNPFEYLSINDCLQGNSRYIKIFERKAFGSCKRTCNIDMRTVKKECIETRNVCIADCRTDSKICKSAYLEEYATCKQSCNVLENKDKRDCLKDCNNEKNIARKDCSIKDCVHECNDDRNSCYDIVKFGYDNCKDGCSYIFEEVQSCNGGEQQAGEMFMEGCNICRCGFDGEVDCKTTEFCNFDKPKIEETSCVESGGLYQQLCNGPYFDIVCTPKKYCVCEGLGEYSCPENNVCLTDFNVRLPRVKQTIEGFKDLLGNPLGDIGICVQSPELETCGNGVCENLVCLSTECPTAENSINCPEDCS